MFPFVFLAVTLMYVSCTDGQRRRGLPGMSSQDFGDDSGNDFGGMDGFHGDWAADDGEGDIEDTFGTDLVAAPRKVWFPRMVYFGVWKYSQSRIC